MEEAPATEGDSFLSSVAATDETAAALLAIQQQLSNISTQVSAQQTTQASLVGLVTTLSTQADEQARAQRALASANDDTLAKLAALQAKADARGKEPELEEDTIESDSKLEYCPYNLAQAGQPLANNNPHPPRPTTENPGYPEVYELEGDKVFTVLRDHKQTKGTESYHEYNTLACAVSFLFDLKQSSFDFAEELATPFDGSDLEEVARRQRIIAGQVNSGQKIYDILNRRLDVIRMRTIAKHENAGQLSAGTKLLLDELQGAIGGFDKGLGLTTATDKRFRAALEAAQERDRKASATAGAKLRGSELNKTAGGGNGGGRAALKPKPKGGAKKPAGSGGKAE